MILAYSVSLCCCSLLKMSFQGCVWPNGRAVITQRLQTTTLETKALITAYFRSTAATGVMMGKPRNQLMPAVFPAAVRQAALGDGTGALGMSYKEARQGEKP